MWETWVRSLGWEDPLEEGMAIHSSILAGRLPMDRGAWWATVHGVAKSWTLLSMQKNKQKYIQSLTITCLLDTSPSLGQHTHLRQPNLLTAMKMWKN